MSAKWLLSFRFINSNFCEMYISPIRAACYGVIHVCDILLMFSEDYISCHKAPHYAVVFVIILLSLSTKYFPQHISLTHLHFPPKL